MKIEQKHWIAASKMMIAAGKAMSPEAITLDVSPLVEGKGGDTGGKKGKKDKEKEEKTPPETPPKTKPEDENPEIKPKEDEPNEAVDSLRIDPFKDDLTNTTYG